MNKNLTRVHFFLFTKMYFEKHCWAASFYAPQSSINSLWDHCVLSKCHSSQVERRIELWQLPVVHLVTKSKTNIVFQFFSLKQGGLTLPVDITIQSEPEKWDKFQILWRKFYNVSDLESKIFNGSDFELKFLQRVTFRNKIFTVRPILNSNFHNASNLELKKEWKTRYILNWKILTIQIW